MGCCSSSYESVAAAQLECAINSGESLTTVDGHLRRVKDINAVLPFCRLTPLELAKTKQNASIVRLMLERGAGMEQRANAQWTPLLRACSQGCLEDAKLLIKSVADTTARTLDGTSCILLAAQNKHHSVVSYLLKQESCTVGGVDAEGYSLLHHVAMFNDPIATSCLISKGLDVDAKTHNGETPLFLASKHNCAASMRVLIDFGADSSICTKDGESPLSAAAQQDNMQILDLLLTIEAITEQKLSDGWTPLLKVCSIGCLEAVKSLVEKGADIETRTPDGLSCLSVAAKNKHYSIVSYLLKQESCPIDVDVDADGYTLLHQVVMFNDPVATSYLISKGLNVDAKTQAGETPVFLAIKRSCLASFRVLLNSGADLNVKTKNGEFALKETVNQGRVDIVTLLLEHGADSTPFIQNGQLPIDLASQVAVARAQTYNSQPSIVQVLNQGNRPDSMETVIETAELASNVLALANNVVGR